MIDNIGPLVILTGDEPRHRYFVSRLVRSGLDVGLVVAEGLEQSLINRTNSALMPWCHEHASSRYEFELEMLHLPNETAQSCETLRISKGTINDPDIIRRISEYQPRLLVCYGCSILRESFVDAFDGKIINVHLGLSPYYRGSGTNVWPIINLEFDLIGATFMWLDKGIDTGNIIHQIRARINMGDSVHSAGLRLIKDMTDSYIKILFSQVAIQNSYPLDASEGRLYLRSDFDEDACRKLYRNFCASNIFDYLHKGSYTSNKKIIVNLEVN